MDGIAAIAAVGGIDTSADLSAQRAGRAASEMEPPFLRLPFVKRLRFVHENESES
jgi:hypothetical protein